MKIEGDATGQVPESFQKSKEYVPNSSKFNLSSVWIPCVCKELEESYCFTGFTGINLLAANMMSMAGVTKEILMYPCPDLNGVTMNLIDTPGVGDHDVTVIALVSMIEAFLTEGMVPGGIRGVVVTQPVPDGRIKLGAQIVQAVVDKGFVAPAGDDKYANIILCGTKVQRDVGRICESHPNVCYV